MEAASVLSSCSPSSSLIQRSHSDSRGNGARCYCSCAVKLNASRGSSVGRLQKRCTVMRWGGGGQDKDSSGEERPETLFMRELAKRKKLGQDIGTDTKTKEESEDKSEKKPQPVSAQDDQRKRSMALNSEGLDGLVPRGQELVKLGGSFWLSLWPFIAASLLAFAAAFLYFGPAFIHSGNRTSPPPYVDPYQLLESEQLPYQVGPNRVPYNTHRSPQ